MNVRSKVFYLSLLQVVGAIATSTILASAPAQSQLIPDSTLGTENSTVNQINPTTQRIDGGAIRSSNLFHSFQQFNVGAGNGVYFSNPVGIENILTRVTGGNPSNIFGKLGVLGDSNLFLINPNGIIFGANASLDIKGSFLATTAPGIKLGENGFFSAVNPNSSQLLSVNPQVIFANNLVNPQAEIVNRGRLEVGKDLTLQGTNLDLQGQLLAKGNLTLQATDTVKMTYSTNNPFIAAVGDIELNANEIISIKSYIKSDSGRIKLSADSIELIYGSAIFTDFFAEDIGSIEINTGSLLLTNNSAIYTGTIGASDGGEININASEYVYLSNSFIGSPSLQGSVGKSGNINITADSIFLDNSSGIEATSYGKKDAGKIFLYANLIRLRDSAIASNSERPRQGNGNDKNAGIININTEDLLLYNNRIFTVKFVGGGGEININALGVMDLNNSIIGSPSLEGSVGKSGEINITANSIFLDNSSAIEAASFGLGNSGNINITANSIFLDNSSGIEATSYGEKDAGKIFLYANLIRLRDSAIASNSERPRQGNGNDKNAGIIDINTENLLLYNSRIFTVKFVGGGGEININALGVMDLNNSIIGSPSLEGSVGKSGEINITANRIFLDNSSAIEAASFGLGNSGNINITANRIFLDSSFITATSREEGNAGQISIYANNLTLKNTIIASDSGTTGSVNDDKNKNTGVININAADNLLLENSEITASSFSGSIPGTIKVEAGKLLDINATKISTTYSIDVAGGTPEETDSAILIETDDLVLRNGASITASTSGQIKGGKISVNASSVSLTNSSSISSESSSNGGAGEIIFEVTRDFEAIDSEITTSSQQSVGGSINISANNIHLLGDSEIRTNVNSGVGGGGNITLNADSIIAFDDSDVLAFATDGKGGDITFNTPVFFGDSFRPAPEGTQPLTLDRNGFVDVNASGAVSGNIALPNLDFLRNSITDLPENVVDTDSIIANSCIVPNERETGSFVVTGSGGLPLRPGDATVSEYPTGQVRAIPEGNSSNIQVVEPQGVYRLPDGKLVLSRRCE